jgi:hypothetical protein
MTRVFLAILAVAIVSTPLQAKSKKEKQREKMEAIRERALASHGEMQGDIILYFRDAETGNPIPQGDVTLEGEEATTDETGKATISNVQLKDTEDTKLYCLFTKEGYVKSKIPMLFRLGSLVNHHFSISPVIPVGHMRVILDWGDKPPDLDAHLVKKGDYHVSYHDKKNVKDKAKLDRDDMDGQGPETITIKKVDPNAEYIYFVHEFGSTEPGSTGISSSYARVTVYTDKQLYKTFEAPTTGTGRYWTVFKLVKGEPVAAESLAETPPDK